MDDVAKTAMLTPGTHPGIKEWFEPALEATCNCCKQGDAVTQVHRLQTYQASIMRCNESEVNQGNKESN